MAINEFHPWGRTANRATPFPLAVRKNKPRGFFIRSAHVLAQIVLGICMVTGAAFLVASGSMLALQYDVFSTSAPETTAMAKRVNLALANPAALNCAQHGGHTRVANTNEGDIGLCKLPNGQICEQWALMRGECKENTNKGAWPQVETKEQVYDYSS